MRSFASLLLACLLVAAIPLPAVAQKADASQADALLEEARTRETALRTELGSASGADRQELLARVRTLVGAYRDMAILFPHSGSADNALWQGAQLAADAFTAYGQAADRAAALRMLQALAGDFPESPLRARAVSQVARLQKAKPRPDLSVSTPAATTPALSAPAAPAARPSAPGPAVRLDAAATPVAAAARPSTARPDPVPAVAATPPTMPSRPSVAAPPIVTPAPPATAARTGAPRPAGVPVLTAITRDVLPEALRVTLHVNAETAFDDRRIDDPARVFVDLATSGIVDSLRNASLTYATDVVQQIRIGAPAAGRARVAFDLRSAGRYSVYALYDPYRIVIDFERPGARRPGVTPASRPDASARRPSVSRPSTASAAGSTSAPAAPPKTATPAPAPRVAAKNADGTFSLSRQLGLGATRIVIDAGHGGHDPGARVRGLSEADLVLDVALRLEKLLARDGVDVVLTRRADTYVALEERTDIANRAGADLFLSIHANASANVKARGVETYFLNFASNKAAEALAARENAGSGRTMRQLPDIVKAIALNDKIDESRDFATAVQASLYRSLRKSNSTLRNLGVKQAPFVVLIGATMPSILAEVSFLTNGSEGRLLKTDRYRQQVAVALHQGITRYQQSLTRVRSVAKQ